MKTIYSNEKNVSLTDPKFRQKIVKLIIWFTTLFLIAAQTLFAEGTKQLRPLATDRGYIELLPTSFGFGNFGLYTANPDERIYIHINNVGEKIFYGFGQTTNGGGTVFNDVVYRIRDPFGNIVVGAPLGNAVPSAGAGFISTHAQAIIGPSAIAAGGYNALVYTAMSIGDYYLEFNANNQRRDFELFDVTVASAANLAIDGRVWSKGWGLTTRSFTNTFRANLYIYTLDQVVTSVDFQGMMPYSFICTANGYGTQNTGVVISDRRSRPGNLSSPQFKVFFNDPDNIAYPSGVIGTITAPTMVTGCPGNYCINVSVNAPGKADILFDLNGTIGYQANTSDILISQTIISAGVNCIPWNGTDGFGNAVNPGTNVPISVSYYFGLTNLPLYDVEYHPNGYKVASIRPSVITPLLLWDDSLIPGVSNLVGCPGNSGCHSWPQTGNGYGNVNTINTWWYANISNDNIIYQVQGIVLNTPSTAITCNGATNGIITIVANGGTSPYAYSWNTGSTQQSLSGLSAGTYQVTVTDAIGCSMNTSTILANPPVLIATITNITDADCNGANISATVAGGTPGYTYNWTPTGGTGINASGIPAGSYILSVTDNSGCNASAFANVNPTPALVASISKTTISCFGGTNGQAMASVSGGTTPYTYNWMPGGASSQTVNGLGAGTYFLTVTDAKGCQVVSNVTISQPAQITLNSSSTANNCGASNGTAAVNVSGGVGPFTYQWIGHGQSAVQHGLTNGSYTVQVTDANGCISETTATVAIGALNGNATLVEANALCYGTKTGTASVNMTGGQTPYTYIWSNGATTQTVTNLAAGSYSVTITTAAGCSRLMSSNILQPQAILTNTSTVNATCGLPNGQAFATASGGLGGFTYTWSPSGINSALATGLAAGIHQVTVTDANGCMQATQVLLQNISGPTVSILSSIDASCNGINNGGLTASISGGTPGFNISWNNGTSGLVNNNLVAGVYVLTVTDANNCIGLVLDTIFEPSPISANITTSNVLCRNGLTGAAKVQPTGGVGGYSYLWLPSNAIGSSISGLAAGNYQVNITDANNCTSLFPFLITEPTLSLSMSIQSSSSVNCYGSNDGQAAVFASGGTGTYSYLWSPSSFTAPSVSGLTSGLHTVTVYDSNNCTAQVSVSISEPNLLTAQLATQQDVSCFGMSNGQVTLSVAGGTPNYQYLWNGTSFATATISGLYAGNHIIQVLDNHQCSAYLFASITQPSDLTTSVSNLTNSRCGAANGSASAVFSGGTTPVTFLWQGVNQTNATATGLLAGNYQVIISDASGCQDSVSATIQDSPTGVASIVNFQHVLCHGGANGQAEVSMTGGAEPFTYAWFPNGGNAAEGAGLTAGNYTVVVTDANSCVTSANITIQEPQFDLSSITVTHSDISCFGFNDGAASVTASGGTAPYQYAWSSNPPQFLSTASMLKPFNYLVRITDANGCENHSFIEIIEPSEVITTLSAPHIVCPSTTVSLTANATGGSGSYLYQWGDSILGSNTLQVMPFATTIYKVSAIDTSGCAGTIAQDTVYVKDISTLGFGVKSSQASLCEGATAQIEANVVNPSEPYTINWNNQIASHFGPHTVSPANTTWYIATLSNICNQTKKDSVEIVVKKKPIVALLPEKIAGCEKAVLQVKNSVNLSNVKSYFWLFSDGSSSAVAEPMKTYKESGEYTVSLRVTNTDGCSANDSEKISVTVFPGSSALFTIDQEEITILQPEVNFTNKSSKATEYAWDFGDATTSNLKNPIHSYAQKGMYLVKLVTVNEFGCRDEYVQELEVKPAFAIFIPNAFTPNDDGLNDRFTAKGIEIHSFNLQIYDRWGERIYEGNDINKGWDGTVKTKDGIAQQDVYVYQIEASDHLGRSHYYTGSVSLIK